MIKKISAASLFSRKFFKPTVLWDFEIEGSASMLADRIGDLTQQISIMRYLDVADEEMERQCLGYFNGSWTDETKEIARAFPLSVSEIVNSYYYRSLGQSWVCPACKRSKIETVRKTKAGKYHLCFVSHHDHMVHAIRASRFKDTVICEDCNNIDPALKASMSGKVISLSNLEPHQVLREFSFSPDELYHIFGKGPPNRKREISRANLDVAIDIYNSHFSDGFEDFAAYVRQQDVKLKFSNSGERVSEFKRPLLDSCDIAEKKMDRAILTLVDNHEVMRPLVSEINRELWVFDLSDRMVLIPCNAIDELKAEFIEAVQNGSNVFR